MKLLNGEIFATKESLEKLVAKELPVKASFRLAKLANKLQPTLTAIEQVRNQLIQKYGEADKDNPQQIRVDPNTENFTKFVTDFNELLSEEVELEIEVVALPEMVDGASLNIEPSVLMALEKFITLEG